MGHDLGTHQRWYASWIDGESVMEEVDRYNAKVWAHGCRAAFMALPLDPPTKWGVEGARVVLASVPRRTSPDMCDRCIKSRREAWCRKESA